MNLAGRLILAPHLQAYHLRELLRQRIADDRDDADGTARHHRECQRVVAGDNVEVAWLVLDNLVYLFQVAAGLLDGHDVLAVAGQPYGGLSLHVDASAARHVVEHHRQLGSGGDGLEVLVKTLLRRLVVIGTDTQHTVDALEVASLQLLHHGSSIVAATTHQNGHARLYLVYNQVLDSLLFLARQHRRLARRGQNAEKVSTVLQLIFHQAQQCLIVHLAVLLERRHQGNTQPLENIVNHKSLVSSY